MKTLILTSIYMLFAAVSFAQDWKPVKIDEAVQVSLPAGFKKTDTLGQMQVTAETQFGFIQITKQPDNPRVTPDIEKLKHLIKYYDDFVGKIGQSAKDGRIIETKDTLLEGLHVKDFTLQVDSGSGKQLRVFRLLHENSATYSFQYLYQDIHAEYSKPEIKQFFESIRILPESSVASQFTSPENTTGKTPDNDNWMYYVGATVVAALVLLFILKRRKVAH